MVGIDFVKKGEDVGSIEVNCPVCGTMITTEDSKTVVTQDWIMDPDTRVLIDGVLECPECGYEIEGEVGPIEKTINLLILSIIIFIITYSGLMILG